jgi:hypothetical protein
VAVLKRVGLVLLLLGGVLLGIWGVRVARTGLSLRNHLQEVQGLASAPEELDPGEACRLVGELREDVVALGSEAGGLARLAPAFGWLPWIGGDLQAAPHLLTVADGLTEAGDLLCFSLSPALATLHGPGGGASGFSLSGAVQLLADERPALSQALSAAQRAEEAWSQVDQDAMSAWLAEKLAVLQRAMPLLRPALEAALVLPDLAGAESPQTYLVLALNEDELRPGGGFITGVGEVRVEAGEIVTMTFRDSYAVDDFTQPYPYPPEPMQRYMGIDQWVFRDSNWSPDFPTAARQALSLYRPGYGVAVAGVIALDQQAVRRVVEAIGPLEIGESEEPVTGDTVISYMRESWAPEGGDMGASWWAQRKSFIGDLAAAAWQRVASGDVDWLGLGRTLLALLEEKHLLIFVENPVAAAALASAGWDGALRSGAGDFLMVVDANVGYNKASARVEEELAYEVDLRSFPPRASLTITYTHTSPVERTCIHDSRYDPVYAQMMDRCYWDYVRVYVPDGCQVLHATAIRVPPDLLLGGIGDSGETVCTAAPEGPWLSCGALVFLPTATSQTRSLSWTLPSDVVEWGAEGSWYALRVQRQPGAASHRLTVSILLPEGTRLLRTTPSVVDVTAASVSFSARLDRDRDFQVWFEGEE